MFNSKLFAVAAIAALALASTACAETILISDTFTDLTSGVLISAGDPEVSLVNDTWQNTRTYTTSNDYTPTANSTGNPDDGVRMKANGAIVSSTGIGTTITEGTLTVMGDVYLGTMGISDEGKGIGIGFWSELSKDTEDNKPAHSYFTGVTVNANGRVSYFQNTNTDGTIENPIASVDWAGGEAFSATEWYTLSYDIDLATGNITSVSLSGSTADYSSLCNTGGYMNATNMLYGGFYSVGTGTSQYGYLDNYSLVSSETIPEPSTMALLGCGLFGLLAYAWRKR